MQLTVEPAVGLTLEVDEGEVEGAGVSTYIMTGPSDVWQKLENACRSKSTKKDAVLMVRGPMSALAPISLNADQRFAAAVPNEAELFSFAHPADYVWLEPDEESGAFGEKIDKSRWLPLEKNLEKLDLTKELWGFFLLVGGFCYFDKDRKPLQGANSTNALTLVPSENTMNFVGPFDPELDAFQALHEEGRMVPITLDALQDAGFKAFGWVNPREAVGGKPLNADESKYAHGAFVYLMQDGSKNFFGLIPPTEEEIEEYKAKLARASDGKRFGLKRLNTQKNNVAEEERQMDQISREAGSGELLKTSIRVRTFIRILSVWFCPFPTVFGLMFLAYYSADLYAICSTLLWYFLFVWISWVPLRDTAALAILQSSPGRVYFYQALQFITPVLLTLMAASFSVSSLERKDSNLIVSIIGMLVVYFALPMTLYILRRDTANKLESKKLGKPPVVTTSDKIAATTERIVEVLSPRSMAAKAAEAKLMVSPRATATVKPGSPVQEVEGAAYRDPVPIEGAPVSAAPSPPPTGRYMMSPPPPLNGMASPGGIDDGTLDDLPVEELPPSPPETNGGSPSPVASPRLPATVATDISPPPSPPEEPLRSPQDVLAKWAGGWENARAKQATRDAQAKTKFGGLLGGKSKKKARVAPAPPKPYVPTGSATDQGNREMFAAIRLQSRMRALKAKRKFKEELADRQKRLRYLSVPIVIASLFDLLCNTIILDLVDRGSLPQDGYWISLIFTLPSILLLLRDMRKKPRPRFSLGHGIFLVTVLYRMAFKAALIDRFVWDRLEEGLEGWRNSSLATSYGVDPVTTAVPLLTMSIHLCVFILVTAFGKMTVNLVATTNACPHLIFPFQFFDFVFLYSFFSLRTMHSALTTSWVLQQVILQFNIVMRNSGTTDALTKKYLGTLFRMLSGTGGGKMASKDPANDPLLRLQYLARIGWQYDMADIAAIIVVPFVVCCFVWRDGYYSLEGTSIMVRSCDVRNVLIRFTALLIIKPFFSTLARMWIKMKMRKTLLGKKTMHGVSELAAKIISERKLASATKDSKGGDSKVHEAFSKVYVEEELLAVKEELSLSGLNYSVLRTRVMKKWKFYAATVIFQLYSAFPCKRAVPRIDSRNVRFGAGVEIDLVNMTLDRLSLQEPWFYVPAVVDGFADVRKSGTGVPILNKLQCGVDGGTACPNVHGFYEHLAVQNNFVLPETMINASIEEGNRNCFPAWSGWPQPAINYTFMGVPMSVDSILYYQVQFGSGDD